MHLPEDDCKEEKNKGKEKMKIMQRKRHATWADYKY